MLNKLYTYEFPYFILNLHNIMESIIILMLGNLNQNMTYMA